MRTYTSDQAEALREFLVYLLYPVAYPGDQFELHFRAYAGTAPISIQLAFFTVNPETGKRQLEELAEVDAPPEFVAAAEDTSKDYLLLAWAGAVGKALSTCTPVPLGRNVQALFRGFAEVARTTRTKEAARAAFTRQLDKTWLGKKLPAKDNPFRSYRGVRYYSTAGVHRVTIPGRAQRAFGTSNGGLDGLRAYIDHVLDG